MAERMYRNGSRREAGKHRSYDGRMSPARVAWIRTAIGTMVILKQDSDEDKEEDLELGPTIRLFLPRPGGRPMQFNLTALTRQELDIMKEFFGLLFELADPVVDQRDKVAQNALANGDDSHARVYRDVPQFIVREGAQREHAQSLRNGPQGVASGDRPDGDHSGRTGDDGGELVDGQSEDRVAQDDGPETY